MPISVSCDCGKTYKVADDKAGKKFKCKECGGVIAVPAEEEVDFGDDWDSAEADEPEEAPEPVRRTRGGSGSRRSKPAASRKKSGGLNPIMIVVSLLGVLLVVGGGVLGYKLLSSVATSVDPLTYIPEDASVFVLVRPQRMLKSPLIQSLPQDVIDEQFKKAQQGGVGTVDFRKIEFFAVAGAPKQEGGIGGPPLASAVFIARGSEPIDAKSIASGDKPGAEPLTEQNYKGKKYWRQTRKVATFSMTPPAAPPVPGAPPTPMAPPALQQTEQTMAIANLDEKTVIGGDEATVLKMLDRAPGSSVLKSRVKSLSLDRDLVMVMLPAALNSGGGMGMPGPLMGPGNPAETMKQLKSLAVSADLTGDSLVSVVFEANDATAAKQIETSTRDGIQKLEGFYQMMTAGMRGPEVPQNQKDLIAFADKLKSGITVSATGSDATLTIKNPGGWEKVTAPLREAMTQAQGAAQRTEQRNNLKQVGLAMHNFHDQNGTFPPAKDGKGAGLSWRVHILPFLEQETLYRQFHLDEPWDSTHNKALIDAMPSVYASPLVTEKGKTRILGFSGNGAMFGATPGISFRDVKDGSSNTVMAIEVPPEKAMIWTQPGDLPFNPDSPLAAIGAIPAAGLEALMMDGAVRRLAASITPETFKGLITTSGGETILDF